MFEYIYYFLMDIFGMVQQYVGIDLQKYLGELYLFIFNMHES